MKRKLESQEPDGIQLRSGKVVKFTGGILPEELNNSLETKLQNFKRLFSGNLEHAKELLKIISKAQTIEIRFNIREKVHEVSDQNNPSKTNPLLSAAGNVAWALVFNPDYRDAILKKIKNFDLETPILGSDEPLTEEL